MELWSSERSKDLGRKFSDFALCVNLYVVNFLTVDLICIKFSRSIGYAKSDLLEIVDKIITGKMKPQANCILFLEEIPCRDKLMQHCVLREAIKNNTQVATVLRAVLCM